MFRDLIKCFHSYSSDSLTYQNDGKGRKEIARSRILTMVCALVLCIVGSKTTGHPGSTVNCGVDCGRMHETCPKMRYFQKVMNKNDLPRVWFCLCCSFVISKPFQCVLPFVFTAPLLGVEVGSGIPGQSGKNRK